MEIQMSRQKIMLEGEDITKLVTSLGFLPPIEMNKGYNNGIEWLFPFNDKPFGMIQLQSYTENHNKAMIDLRKGLQRKLGKFKVENRKWYIYKSDRLYIGVLIILNVR